MNKLSPQYDCCDKYLTQKEWSSEGNCWINSQSRNITIKVYVYEEWIKLCLPLFDPRFNDLQISFWGYALEQQQLRIY